MPRGCTEAFLQLGGMHVYALGEIDVAQDVKWSVTCYPLVSL
jgi:hypothetical protein